jgi:nucleoside-diphosphate-sugar epimerase
MTVLVTGGSGLVGSHVILALRSRGEHVRALVRERSAPAVQALGADAVVGDVTDPEAWRRAAAGVRGIVHAAALVAQRGTLADFLAVNVGGTRQAIAAARTLGSATRLVHISSVAVYGRTGPYAAGAGVTEDFPFGTIAPHDYYAQSKREAEHVLWEEQGHGGFTAVAIRPNVVYGEYDRLFSPRVVRAVRQGAVPQVGTGMNRLSCIYAGNVAAAVVRALDVAEVPAGGRAYNVTDDGAAALTQRAFVDAFAAALGVRVRRIRLPYRLARLAVDLWARWQLVLHPASYPGIGSSAVRFLAGDNPYSAERARRELRWIPPTAAPEAVARTVRWVRANEKPGR